jgi:hypothetical protein
MEFSYLCALPPYNSIVPHPQKSRLDYRNVVVDLGSVLLRNALGNPNDVSALLLLQLQVRVEHAKVELL